MWLFTRTGFISVTDDKTRPHHFLVRARVKADLERLRTEMDAEGIAILETPERDYGFRMTVHKADFVKVMVDQLMEIDYTNVKDAIDLGEPERHAAMLRVWSAMSVLQPGAPWARWSYPPLEEQPWPDDDEHYLDDFTEHEEGVMAGLVRDALRKVERNRASAQRKWGADYDPTAHDQRDALLRSAYAKLGGDPDRITNLDGRAAAP